MLEDPEYRADSAYTLSLPAPNRPTAATEISIRVDDGADISIDFAGPARERLTAYLTLDQAEELYAALTEILRFPSDQTGAVDVTGPIRKSDPGDAVPKPR